VNIRQEKEESLRFFIERFGKLSLQIQNLNPEVTLHHLDTTLKPRLFSNILCKKLAADLEELRRAKKFM